MPKFLSNLDVDASADVAGGLVVGANQAGHDVKFFGATDAKYMLWDESADTLIVDGAVDINGNADISGNLVIAGTVDGVDISALPTSFAPTDATATNTLNVTNAGALMDSEVDANIQTFALPANTTISAYGATLVDDANAAAARSTLGLGAAALKGVDTGYPTSTSANLVIASGIYDYFSDGSAVIDLGSSTGLGVAGGGTGLSTVGTNQVLTGNGTGSLTSEANLTFNGSELSITGTINSSSNIYSDGNITCDGDMVTQGGMFTDTLDVANISNRW